MEGTAEASFVLKSEISGVTFRYVERYLQNLAEVVGRNVVAEVGTAESRAVAGTCAVAVEAAYQAEEGGTADVPSYVAAGGRRVASGCHRMPILDSPIRASRTGFQHGVHTCSRRRERLAPLKRRICE